MYSKMLFEKIYLQYKQLEERLWAAVKCSVGPQNFAVLEKRYSTFRGKNQHLLLTPRFHWAQESKAKRIKVSSEGSSYIACVHQVGTRWAPGGHRLGTR